MTPLEVIVAKRAHLARFANQSGAAGEQDAILAMELWVPFALTESESAAAERLGSRHRVALFNNSTGELLITSVPEIISRAKSMNWQLSVQL